MKNKAFSKFCEIMDFFILAGSLGLVSDDKNLYLSVAEDGAYIQHQKFDAQKVVIEFEKNLFTVQKPKPYVDYILATIEKYENHPLLNGPLAEWEESWEEEHHDIDEERSLFAMKHHCDEFILIVESIKSGVLNCIDNYPSNLRNITESEVKDLSNLEKILLLKILQEDKLFPKHNPQYETIMKDEMCLVSAVTGLGIETIKERYKEADKIIRAWDGLTKGQIKYKIQNLKTIRELLIPLKYEESIKRINKIINKLDPQSYYDNLPDV